MCPAVHYGIINYGYWLNPYHSMDKVFDLGTTQDTEDRPKLATFLEHGYMLNWQGENASKLCLGNTKEIPFDKIEIPGKFILDIDLDAFCCISPDDTASSMENLLNYSKRIRAMETLLRHLVKRPN